MQKSLEKIKPDTIISVYGYYSERLKKKSHSSKQLKIILKYTYGVFHTLLFHN